MPLHLTFTVWAFNIHWQYFFLPNSIQYIKYNAIWCGTVQCNACLLVRIFPAYTKLIIICTNPYWMANVCAELVNGKWFCICKCIFFIFSLLAKLFDTRTKLIICILVGIPIYSMWTNNKGGAVQWMYVFNRSKKYSERKYTYSIWDLFNFFLFLLLNRYNVNILAQ